MSEAVCFNRPYNEALIHRTFVDDSFFCSAIRIESSHEAKASTVIHLLSTDYALHMQLSYLKVYFVYYLSMILLADWPAE